MSTTTLTEVIKDIIWDEDKGLFENLLGYAPFVASFVSPIAAIALTALSAMGISLSSLGKMMDDALGGKMPDSSNMLAVAKEVGSSLSGAEAVTAAIGFRSGFKVYAAGIDRALLGRVSNQGASISDLEDFIKMLETQFPTNKKARDDLLKKIHESNIKSLYNKSSISDRLKYALNVEVLKRDTFDAREKSIAERNNRAFEQKMTLEDKKTESVKEKSRQSTSAKEQAFNLQERAKDSDFERRQREADQARIRQGLPVFKSTEEAEAYEKTQKAKSLRDAKIAAKAAEKNAFRLALAQQGKSIIGHRFKQGMIASVVLAAIAAVLKAGISPPTTSSTSSSVSATENPDGSPRAKEDGGGHLVNHINSNLSKILSR